MFASIGIALGSALIAIAALHVAWGIGVPWPFASGEELTMKAVGTGGMPKQPVVFAVALALLMAGLIALTRGGVLPELAPHWTYAFGMWVVAAVLLLRALVGPLLSTKTTPEFARLNNRIYSPLVLVLGLLALSLAMR